MNNKNTWVDLSLASTGDMINEIAKRHLTLVVLASKLIKDGDDIEHMSFLRGDVSLIVGVLTIHAKRLIDKEIGAVLGDSMNLLG